MKFLCRYWPILVLALWFGGMSVALDTAIRRFEANTSSAPPVPGRDEPWRHARLFTDPDSYAWLSHTRDLRASQGFRIRHTGQDNAPYGRSVHWSQLPIWSLCVLSAALEKAGAAPPLALELAGRALLPLVGFLVFSALFLFLAKRVPVHLAATFSIGLAVILFWDFHPLRPDHQAFQWSAVFFFWLQLFFSGFGFVPAGERPRPTPFVLSGLAAGFALWFGATVFFFTLAAAALGVAFALFPRNTPSHTVHPGLWRVWAVSGAVPALAFWLLEYAPCHFSMRLEVNHPLYALSLLGVGECLCLLARLRHGGQRLSPRFLLHAVLALSAAALLPALLLFGPVVFYTPRAPVMSRLFTRHVEECLSLASYAEGTGYSASTFFLLAVGPGLLAFLFFLVRSSAFSRVPEVRRRMAFVLPAFFLFSLAYILQNRWKTHAIWASSLLLLSVLLALAPDQRRRLVAGCLFLPFALQAVLFFVPDVLTLRWTWRAEKADPVIYSALQERNFFFNWKQHAGDTPVRILGPASFAPIVHWSGLGDSVASFYWENLEGATAAAAAFADPGPGAPTALRLVRERGITHLLMLEGAQDALMFYNLHTGRDDQLGAARTLGGLLAGAFPGAPLPSWLEDDSELNNAVNPPVCTFVPSLGKWCQQTYPLHIFTVRPEVLAERGGG